jgi:NADH:ubiquinone oxidoreductase subunit F (NADH-binding)
MKDIIKKIEDAGLIGRGGAGFPTAKKWQMVKAAKGSPKYVVSNASEGELGLHKDIFILQNYPEMVFKGMKLAMDYVGTKEAYFNFNRRYYFMVKWKIRSLIREYAKKGYHFNIYEEHPSYIGGEETALLNAIEGKRVQPRLKPPYPVERGLYGKPTIINNIETFFNAAQAAEGTYEHKRFYCLNGPIRQPGVYHLPEDLTLDDILDETGNWPNYKFFVQIGGSSSGPVLHYNQLADTKMTGAGSLEVYSAKTTPRELLTKWFKFYSEESCGKCTPCREGSYQLYELIRQPGEIRWEEILEIIDAMEYTSFCGLGCSIGMPVKTYMKNVLKMKI